MVFAWDLRWPQQPIILSGLGSGEAVSNSLSESEVWEVRYDRYTKSSNISSARVLPAMICSEDGILAVVEQGNVFCLGIGEMPTSSVIYITKKCFKLFLSFFLFFSFKYLNHNPNHPNNYNLS